MAVGYAAAEPPCATREHCGPWYWEGHRQYLVPLVELDVQVPPFWQAGEQAAVGEVVGAALAGVA